MYRIYILKSLHKLFLLNWFPITTTIQNAHVLIKIHQLLKLARPHSKGLKNAY